jgi:hypothetical protein
VDWSGATLAENVCRLYRRGKYGARENKMEIENRIKSIIQNTSVKVSFHWGMDRVNDALEGSDGETRFSLTMDLFNLWLERSDETKNVFWEILGREERGMDVFFSLTTDGRQLRVWFEKPEPRRARPEHVDSMGRGLLFEVKGAPQAVKHYLQGLLRIKHLEATYLDNGVIFYG